MLIVVNALAHARGLAYHLSTIMAEIDMAQEWRRLQELYAGMSVEELGAVADQGYELTDIAKQALNAEISRRRLQVIVRLAPPQPEPQVEGDPEFDPANLDLAFAFTVENREEAERAKKTLNDAGIPCYFGPDLLEDVDRVKFVEDRPIDAAVLRSDLQRVLHGIRIYSEKFPRAANAEPVDFVVRCPKCNSPEIMLLDPEYGSSDEPDQDEDSDAEERSEADPAPEASEASFTWKCDACGYEWKD